ncbi:hypothetical protein [Amycolatopsis sp. GM8]|uniref:hypothetical protein n=1 Tax=Amycolatopsis sp. GM8 TaxID=2896530 RepID=UPI001F23BFDC|nr:hypothetical protein [Amycolatopsis sp. GM8]
MRRTLARAAAWTATTAAAIALSWFGVHSVLATDAIGPAPQAIPITAPATTTVAPSPTLTPPTSTAPPRPSSPAVPATTSSSPAADVRGYQLSGGRVVLELGAASAKLVSATPEAGWQVQAWQADGWLRVDFSRDGTTSSCFVTWNGHPPTVQTT